MEGLLFSRVYPFVSYLYQPEIRPGAHIRCVCVCVWGGGGGRGTPLAFQNRLKVCPKKCILDNQFGPRFGPRTFNILDRYIYI